MCNWSRGTPKQGRAVRPEAGPVAASRYSQPSPAILASYTGMEPLTFAVATDTNLIQKQSPGHAAFSTPTTKATPDRPLKVAPSMHNYDMSNRNFPRTRARDHSIPGTHFWPV